MTMSERLRAAPQAAPAPTISPQTEADVHLLRQVREYLTPPGRWRQDGQYVDPDACVLLIRGVLPPTCPTCLFGAVMMVTGRFTPVNQEDMVARELGFPGHRAATEWNDDPTTTHDMVLARLDAAIERLEGGR